MTMKQDDTISDITDAQLLALDEHLTQTHRLLGIIDEMSGHPMLTDKQQVHLDNLYAEANAVDNIAYDRLHHAKAVLNIDPDDPVSTYLTDTPVNWSKATLTFPPEADDEGVTPTDADGFATAVADGEYAELELSTGDVLVTDGSADGEYTPYVKPHGDHGDAHPTDILTDIGVAIEEALDVTVTNMAYDSEDNIFRPQMGKPEVADAD